MVRPMYFSASMFIYILISYGLIFANNFFLRNFILLTSIMDYAHVSLFTKLGDKLVKYLVLSAALVVNSYMENNIK